MRLLGSLMVASYLFAGCFLLPWAGEVKDKVEQTGQALAQVGAHPAKERPDPDDKPEHNCACDLSHDNRSPFFWCDENGNRDKNGTHACCDDCGKVCGQVRSMPKAANDHACGCGPSDPDDPPTVIVEPCDEAGKYKSDGEYLCCATCHAVCRRKPYTEPAKRKKPPMPVPLPPDCDLTTHCRGKEECAIGDGRCCTNCHQACP